MPEIKMNECWGCGGTGSVLSDCAEDLSDTESCSICHGTGKVPCSLKEPSPHPLPTEEERQEEMEASLKAVQEMTGLKPDFFEKMRSRKEGEKKPSDPPA